MEVVDGHARLSPGYIRRAAPGVYTWLDRLQALLEAQHQPSGTWVPVSQLSQPAREDIDAACGQALQELAPIASIAEPRNT